MDSTQVLPLLLHFDQHLGSAISAYGTLVYGILFAVVFCEIGLLPLFFLPGDPLLFICGAFCASGALKLWILMPVLLVAAVAGSLLNFAIGKAIGTRVLAGDYRWIHRDALRKTHDFYQRHGGLTLLLSPFVSVVRTFAPFVAGVSAMPAARFALAASAGAALWVISLLVGGYLFGNVPLVRDHMSALVLLGLALGLGSLLVASAWRAVRARQGARG
ncbi:VTT domain-containing protein [Cupriavidus basilensis]|uniref:VTT domain-containing protein n=1 Tax=Cupriavidus basilensis TaxID=68895 RepID=A0ABT6AX49_9BURK|nr:VTT domain-containing protein [Cupriavidus basilensis]MDF3837200.1 VTT domain-containing protein [Cupriavidus basilensis]